MAGTDITNNLKNNPDLKNASNQYNEEIEKVTNEIIVFISFDLVNSTKFKTDEKGQVIWPFVINKLYELLLSSLKELNDKISIWKYLGDEILLYVPLSEVSNLYELPLNIYNTQNNVADNLKNTYPGLVDNLDLKSTIWIADISYNVFNSTIDERELLREGKKHRNIGVQLPEKIGEDNDKYFTDFLGADLDEGFRVAKYAYHHKVTLSCAFAYLLYKMELPDNEERIDSNLKIISLEVLKGIWNSRYYPIIWYSPNWNNYEQEYIYDEHLHSDILNKLKNSNALPIDHLHNILTDLEKIDEMNKFVNKCKKIIK